MGFDWSTPLQLMAKVLIPFGLIQQATDFTNVFYKNAHGVTLHAYLKYPPNFNASLVYPAALVFHAWNGMSNEPVYFADLLAEQGFIVLAPDLFRNVATCETNLPWNIINTLVTPQDRMNDDVDAAIAYLTQNTNVDFNRIFSGPGFCFGGSQALNLAIRRPMAGTISLYGANIDGLQDASNDKLWANLGAGGTLVLGIYGADDGAPTPGEARGFQAAMTARGIGNQVTIYDGVGHAFVNPEDHSDGKPQAAAAWNEVVKFITAQAASRRALKQPAAGIAELRDSTYHGIYQRNSPSFSMLWDHATDLLYGKGHFHHGLRTEKKISQASEAEDV